MYKISDIQSNYDAATTGFSEGKMRDNPGDDTGSGVVAALCNDLYYGMVAVVKKWKNSGVLSSAAESETASDFLQAMEELSGNYVDGVSAWSSATTYTTIGDPVMRYGMQFVNISASNLNHDPITSPTYWMAVPDKRELLAASQQGRVIWGDSSAQHGYSNASYAQYFKLGLHRFGGSAGAVYQGYLVHLDGSSVGSGALSPIIEAWHLKDLFAPGSTGARTLVDSRGRVPRANTATGGLCPTIGAVIEDAFQGHYHNSTLQNDGTVPNSSSGIPPYGAPGFEVTLPYARQPVTDGTNGTPRTAAETRPVAAPHPVMSCRRHAPAVAARLLLDSARAFDARAAGYVARLCKGITQ